MPNLVLHVKGGQKRALCKKCQRLMVVARMKRFVCRSCRVDPTIAFMRRAKAVQEWLEAQRA